MTTILGLGAGSMALQPYEHFIPVREDLADLPQLIEWARAHDSLCQRIAENGQRIAMERLGTVAAGVGYMYGALQEYVRLFESDVR